MQENKITIIINKSIEEVFEFTAVSDNYFFLIST